jgi:hypothetical protein
LFVASIGNAKATLTSTDEKGVGGVELTIRPGGAIDIFSWARVRPLVLRRSK